MFLFPIRTPLFPHNSLVTRVNPTLYESLTKNKIEHVGAFVIKDDSKLKFVEPNSDIEFKGEEVKHKS